MCGIAGGISFTENFFPSKSELADAAHCLRYRGPDDCGDIQVVTSNARVSLAHTRLSIIDLSATGHQPMQSLSKRSIIVFNGEIYNYLELRKELQLLDKEFRTQSDTEVLLNGFECWGLENLLQKVDGMFAFALFDTETDTLHLARDRFGKKPLYYFAGNQQLAFSSDIRSFEKIPGIPLNLDMLALGYFFAEQSTPAESTIWQQIKKVPPASFLSFKKSGIQQCKSYWELGYTADCQLSLPDIIDRTDALLSQAVKKRLVADVSVSALLSGGIDSSLVVAKMAEHSSARVKTYSVGFSHAGFNELPYAKQVAERFDTKHTELVIDSINLDQINALILEYGEPFADSSMIPTYLMCKEISRTEKVVLGGDGGDELFGGYDSYYFALKFDQVKKLGFALPLVKVLEKAFPTYRAKFLTRLLSRSKDPRYTLLNRNFGFSEADLRQLYNNSSFVNAQRIEHERSWNAYSPGSSHEVINVMAASLRTRLVNDYLVKVDRASMFASLEMRTPFLDKDIASFAATLGPSQIFHQGPKFILRAMASKIFSDEFVNRKKMGFGIPIGEWFKGNLLISLKEVLLGGRQHEVDLNYQFIEKILNEHVAGVKDHTTALWSLYVFHIWANNR